MTLIEQIDAIKSEKRLELIKSICQKKKKKESVSFASAMHAIDKGEKAFLSQDASDFVKVERDDFHEQDFSQAFG